MFYEIQPSQVYLSYKNVDIYTAYKNDDYDSPLTYWFGVSPWVTDSDVDEERAMFDIRDTRTESFPFGKRTLETPYKYDPHKTLDQNLINLIKLGGIDNQDFIEDTVYAFTTNEGEEEVMQIYKASDKSMDDVFKSLKFANMQAGDIIHLYATLVEKIDKNEIYIDKNGQKEKL